MENQAWKVRQFLNEEVSIGVVLENVLGKKSKNTFLIRKRGKLT